MLNLSLSTSIVFHGFETDEIFLKYFNSTCVAGHKLCKFTYDSFFSLILFSVNIFLGPTLLFLLGMWIKGCWDFPLTNQETNNSIESYHCLLKSKFVLDRWKKCGQRMDWLIYYLLKNVEPFTYLGIFWKKLDIWIITRRRISLNPWWRKQNDLPIVIAGLMRENRMLIGWEVKPIATRNTLSPGITHFFKDVTTLGLFMEIPESMP